MYMFWLEVVKVGLQSRCVLVLINEDEDECLLNLRVRMGIRRWKKVAFVFVFKRTNSSQNPIQRSSIVAVPRERRAPKDA